MARCLRHGVSFPLYYRRREIRHRYSAEGHVDLMDLLADLGTLIIQGDETWSFVFKKEARVDPTKDPAEWGDAYTFIGLDAVARLVVS